MVKHFCGHSGQRALKLTVSQEGRHKSVKAKIYFEKYWMVAVKNDYCFFGYGSLKSVLFQD